MRLSEYVASPKSQAAVAPKVLAVVTPVLGALGAGEDPEGWLAWGEEPAVRWMFLAPTTAGLVTCQVRVNVPGEGPRASGKVGRWGRIQVGELAMETSPGGHRVTAFQVESVVLRGGDEDADAIAAFALTVFDAMDGRVPVARTAVTTPTAPTGSAEGVPLPPPSPG
jgi:hypothetical protein